MSALALVIALMVALVVLYVGFKIIKGCLSKIVIGLIILGALAYLAYWYFTK